MFYVEEVYSLYDGCNQHCRNDTLFNLCDKDDRSNIAGVGEIETRSICSHNGNCIMLFSIIEH